jgi:hypothetical protein
MEKILDLSQEEQIEQHLASFYKDAIEWISGWMRVMETEPRLNFLLVTHDELVESEKTYFEKILDFYGLKAEIQTIAKDANAHFRKGDNEDWRQHMTPDQIRRANEAIPDWMWNRFGWKK